MVRRQALEVPLRSLFQTYVPLALGALHEARVSAAVPLPPGNEYQGFVSFSFFFFVKNKKVSCSHCFASLKLLICEQIWI